MPLSPSIIRTDVTPNVTLVDTCRFAVSVRKVTLESGDVTRPESDVTLLPRTSPPRLTPAASWELVSDRPQA